MYKLPYYITHLYCKLLVGNSTSISTLMADDGAYHIGAAVAAWPQNCRYTLVYNGNFTTEPPSKLILVSIKVSLFLVTVFFLQRKGICHNLSSLERNLATIYQIPRRRFFGIFCLFSCYCLYNC